MPHFSFSQVMQAMWTFIPVERASLQPVPTTLSRCGTLGPIRCYNTTKVKHISNSVYRLYKFTVKSFEDNDHLLQFALTPLTFLALMQG